MRVFWAHGYEGTSMADLVAATNLSRASIYAAFGNKESLFFKALERYLAGPGSYFATALAQPTAARVARQVLYSAIDTVAGEGTPQGCLSVQGALVVGPRSAHLRERMEKYGQDATVHLAERFRRAQQDGDLPGHADVTVLAQFVVTVSQGIAVQAAAGAARQQLRLIADQAMTTWP
ncbi:helix-turn-helix transcriptional regulator [Catenulispora sp. NL8]|uniref:Helix-turn-helix transcriptional regulator n=1 Tax=Catenulispora pinistramenti TaxID=2705254 RepID=A0ABS5KJ37_9ACTN|nr:TetR/AcrR family transcriptional regulator [Catenulispora pinistramenti]MBS2546414.1 helix-turn-helix transcriptional regulator [Catenulispora pinistramenti]